MVLVGKSEDSADGLLGDLQAELQYNQYLIRTLANSTTAECGRKANLLHVISVPFSPEAVASHPVVCVSGDASDYIVVDDLTMMKCAGARHVYVR